MGIISAGIERTRGNQYTGNMELPEIGGSKTEILASAGIAQQRANEAEK